ncbi:hypothetical protein L107_12500 [Cyanobium sp. Copco_Reservoir_LC18]|uniref:hypothetical protein n=1 Tax=Cyanobium sp. Copco_Reservoir_LC18 TaxID=1328305 RepID=UPI00135C3360|nr:hypothetical protein [Cyanobium sp. Copco_Reservoir_LC18]KAF0652974.1 hypothetical protein L107_12500 [Cyanobium sp. Copco_Reservoir_LC18]
MDQALWPTAAELRQQLQSDPPGARSDCIDQLRWLGRYSLAEQLQDWVRRLHASPHWDAALALEVSAAWLLAGRPHQADLAFLEADRLDPSLALVPDVWGLWPAPAAPAAPTPEEHRAGVRELASWIRRWRAGDPRVLEAAWRRSAQLDWTVVLDGPSLDELALLLRRGEALSEPIEPFLASLVTEKEIEASPSQALRFWGVLTDMRPDWSHARIKAADLALAAGATERSAGWITTAAPDIQTSPWYWDIAARQALDSGAIALALDHWGQALARADSELAEVFRQRRREARRGAGVRQVRELLDRGDIPAALPLVQRLVAEDPEWQPLRSLLRQAEAAAAPAAATATDPAGESGPLPFARFLAQAAARSGIPLHPATPEPAGANLDIEACRQELQRFARSIGEAEARFALEG